MGCGGVGCLPGGVAWCLKWWLGTICVAFCIENTIFEVNSKILLKGRQAALLGGAEAPVVANDAFLRRHFEKY